MWLSKKLKDLRIQGSVCIFSGPITGFLGGKFSIPGPHALEPDLKVDGCKNKSKQENIIYVDIMSMSYI